MLAIHRLVVIGILTLGSWIGIAACSNDGSNDEGSENDATGGLGGESSTGSETSDATSSLSGDGDGDVQGDGDASTDSGDGGFGSSTSSDGEAGASCDCGGVACQCSDGVDNDGDSPDGIQSIDGLDIECTGACDDDEGSFATGIPGDNKDPHQDCFFDGDSGAGNDGCKDRDDPSAECLDFCAPLTPNGCDCFGCCTVTLSDGGTTTVQLGGTCSDADLIEDATQCQACTQSDSCKNECGECELCPGRDPQDIPASCSPDSGDGDTGDGDGDPPNFVCDNGATPCTSSEQCGSDSYCQTGCCVQIVLR